MICRATGCNNPTVQHHLLCSSCEESEERRREDIAGLTPLQLTEREAMTGDRSAVLRIVSALREYRREVKQLLERRYSDGEVDGATLHGFASAIDDIENPSGDG